MIARNANQEPTAQDVEHQPPERTDNLLSFKLFIATGRDSRDGSDVSLHGSGSGASVRRADRHSGLSDLGG